MAARRHHTNRMHVGLVGFRGSCECVVEVQDCLLGTVGPRRLFVLAANNREGVEDVGRVVAVDAVEVEEGGVELAAQSETAF
jgi:hypothetical protein